MNQIDQALQELLSAIRSGTEYEEYQRMRSKMHQEPELERQLHEFRKKSFELQNSKGNWDRIEQAERLSKEYAQLLAAPMVNAYLGAELAFCRVMQNINWELIRGIDFEVGFEIDQM